MKTILLLEDEPDVAKIFRLILEGAGYSLLEAANAEKARKGIYFYEMICE